MGMDGFYGIEKLLVLLVVLARRAYRLRLNGLRLLVAEALCTIYSKSELRKDLSAAGLERSKLFSWERCAVETMQAYEKALAM